MARRKRRTSIREAVVVVRRSDAEITYPYGRVRSGQGRACIPTPRPSVCLDVLGYLLVVVRSGGMPSRSALVRIQETQEIRRGFIPPTR